MAQWTVRHEGAVAVVSFDDGKANALTLPEFESLDAAMTEVEKSPALAMVLTGRAGYFSAGLNLKVLPTLALPDLKHLITRFGEIALRLFTFPKPVVAAVSGHALGAGGMFAWAADERVQAEGPFKFGLNEVPAGLFVPTFGIEICRASAPNPMLTQLLVHGKVWSPEEQALYRISTVVPGDKLLSTAMERANALTELAGQGYALTKKLVRGPAADFARSRIPIEVELLSQALVGAAKK